MKCIQCGSQLRPQRTHKGGWRHPPEETPGWKCLMCDFEYTVDVWQTRRYQHGSGKSIRVPNRCLLVMDTSTVRVK